MKMGVVAGLYCLSSAKPDILVSAGLLLCLGFLIVIIRKIVKELMNHRSTFNRKYLFFRKDPTFIRVRLSLEVMRRFLYILLAFSFAGYGLHRLTGNGIAFYAAPTDTSLFLLHLQSTIHCMTSLADSAISYQGNLGVGFQIVTCLFAFLIITPFVAILLEGFASAKRIENRDRTWSSETALRLQESGINTKNDLEAWLELQVEKQLENHGVNVTSTTDIMADLGADSLDMQEIRVALEEFLEVDVADSELGSKVKVGEIVEVFWQHFEMGKRMKPAGVSRIDKGNT